MVVLYVAASSALEGLKFSFAAVPPGVPPWYLPPALSLFVILAFGVQYTPAVFLAYALPLAVDRAAQTHALAQIYEGAISAIVYGAAGYVLRVRLGYDPLKRRIRDVANLVIVAGLGAPLVIALASALFGIARGQLPIGQLPVTVGEGWIERSVGIVAVLPFLMFYVTPAARRIFGMPLKMPQLEMSSMPALTTLELSGQLAAAGAVLTLAFATGRGGIERPSYFYLYFLPLAWIVLRLGLAGAIVANAATDIATMILSEAFRYPTAAIIDIQQFILAISLTSLLMGGVVSARARAERKLRIAREQLTRAEEASSTMILHVALDTRCLKAPVAFCALLKREQSDVESMHLPQLVAPEDRSSVELALHRLGEAEARTVDLQVRFLDAHGGIVWLYLNVSAVYGVADQPEFLLVFAHDITAQRRLAQEVAYLAYHDALTGLPNRSMLEEHLLPALERARRSGRAVAVIFVDLDGFKSINDTLGHAAGDDVLKQIASRLRGCARATDLVVRLSGDEFLVLVTDIDRTGAAEGIDGYEHVPFTVAANIHHALERAITTGGREFTVSASLGISIFPIDAHDSESLIRHADEAMYRSKRTGWGRTQLYGETMAEGGRATLAARLFSAVDRHEFVLHYQPIVDLEAASRKGSGGASGLARAIVGVEALLRWNDRGVIAMPDTFLPFLESSGFIEQVGAWANQEAVRQAATWMSRWRLQALSINLSLRQLQRPEAAENLLAMLREARIDPRRISVDIPAGISAVHSERVERALQALTDAGVRLAIDDFGTNVSSLTALSSLSVKSIKIDRELIAKITDEGEAAILATLLALASNLRMEAIAEGIETEDQRLALIELGCRLGQGYLFSPPVSADEISRLLSARLHGIKDNMTKRSPR